MVNFIKKLFNIDNSEYKYKATTEFMKTEIGKKYGVIGSTHGNVIAYKKIVNDLISRHKVETIFHCGDIMDGHGGYIESVELTINHPKIVSVTGNHDLLLVGLDDIHNYGDEHLLLARKAQDNLKAYPELVKYIAEMPAKIETTFFSIVHECVEYPYFAKYSTLKKKSSDFGKTADENMAAVFNSSLKHPHFTGASHKSYVMECDVVVKLNHIKPDVSVNIKGSKVISVPSVSLSKDNDFVHGYGIVEVKEDGSIDVTMKDVSETLIWSNDIL